MNDESSELKVSDIVRIRLNPGDILVVRVSYALSAEAVERICQHIQPVLDAAGHKDVKVLVLDSQTELDVISAGRDREQP